jgi:nickel-dependent lactate racemase
MSDSDRNGFSVDVPYGAQTASATLPGGTLLGTLDVSDVPALPQLESEINDALENPIGQERSIFNIVSPGETVAIVVSDSFRQTRVDMVLPVLIAGLLDAGIDESDISFTYSTGTHRGPTPEEEQRILGDEIYQRFKDQTYTHDPRDTGNLAYVGSTARGTSVHINRRVHEADRIIATGAVVLHYFGGYGGGRKSIVPGVSSVETIASNHSMNLHPTEDKLDPAVRIGGIDGNPVAEDMLEAAKLTHVDCIVNTVLNRKGEIARVFAGDMEAAHAQACEYARELFAVEIDERADLVIAASPSTQNFVQTHKALFNSYQAVKPDGRIVLLAPCAEGLGGDQFGKWLRLGTREAIIAGLRKESEINGQTALSTTAKSPITVLVTEMDDDDVATLGARRADSLQAAIDLVVGELAAAGRPDPTCFVMPSAAYTVPFPPEDVALDDAVADVA